MKIDRYFDPEQNPLTISANIILQLKSSGTSEISSFLTELETKFPGTYDNYAFEALGLLFLVGKVVLSAENDTIGFDNETN